MLNGLKSLVLAGLVVGSFATNVYAEVSGSISSLEWLAGDWFAQDNGTATEIHYTSPRAGTVLGVIRVTAGDKVTFFEFQRIEEKDGGLVLNPSPFGQPGVAFKAAEIGNERIVFENPEHEFPRKITLAINDDGNLLMRVEGKQNGQEVSQQFAVPRK